MTLQAVPEEALRWEVLQLEISTFLAGVPRAVLAKEGLLAHGVNGPAVTVDHLGTQSPQFRSEQHDVICAWSTSAVLVPLKPYEQASVLPGQSSSWSATK